MLKPELDLPVRSARDNGLARSPCGGMPPAAGILESRGLRAGKVCSSPSSDEF